MKHTVFLSISLVALSMGAKDLKANLDLSHNLWWEAPEVPVVKFTLTDTLGNLNESDLTFRVTSDRDESRDLVKFTGKTHILAGDKQSVQYTINVAEPGFYKCFIYDDGNLIKKFNIGYEPTLVVSLPDAKPDFDQFWDTALSELAAVPGNYTITEDPEKSGKLRKAYKVTMQSLGDETIKAYLYMPVEPGQYPAQIYYNGYGGKPWDMDPDGRPGWIELVTSVRGQFYSEPDNKYGDWIRYNLDKPSEYYYKGAYMDAVRAIDFVSQLDNVDTTNIYAEGGSQGGALTLAAAALGGGRLRAIMPYIPFLSDFRDYFKIVNWPADPVKEEAARIGLTDDQVYDNLTYFDIKNLARRITCPVMMGIGLQDPTCPPHTNMASYALIKAPKSLTIYPTCGHTVDYADWNPRRDAFIADIMNCTK